MHCFYYFIQYEAWGKYWNRYRGKHDFKGSSVKTPEPMVSIKVTNYSIQLGWILARDSISKNYMGSRPEAKKCDFFIVCVRMDGWMCVPFFRPRFFPNRLTNSTQKVQIYSIHIYLLFTLSNAKHRESIVIGLAESATSKGPQVKTTEPMVSIKVTNYSIQLGWILARDGFAKNYMGSRPEAKKCDFIILSVRMDDSFFNRLQKRRNFSIRLNFFFFFFVCYLISSSIVNRFWWFFWNWVQYSFRFFYKKKQS